MTFISAITDSLPVWAVVGTIAVVGWIAEHEVEQERSISTLQTKTEMYQNDVAEIKASVIRIEEKFYNESNRRQVVGTAWEAR